MLEQVNHLTVRTTREDVTFVGDIMQVGAPMEVHANSNTSMLYVTNLVTELTYVERQTISIILTIVIPMKVEETQVIPLEMEARVGMVMKIIIITIMEIKIRMIKRNHITTIKNRSCYEII